MCRAEGLVDLEELEANLDESTAVFIITNPNTLGLFERRSHRISRLLHQAGGLVYVEART